MEALSELSWTGVSPRSNGVYTSLTGSICRKEVPPSMRSRDDGGMTRGQRVLIAVGLFAAGAASAAWVVFLISQGLERADKWSSVGGFLGIVVFGVAGLVVSLRERHGTSNSQAVSTSADTSAGAAAGSRVGSSGAAEGPPTETMPSSGSVFHIDAETAYTAHEMTVYNDGSNDRKQ